MATRRIAVGNQSPGLAEKAQGSYTTQLNSITKDRKATKTRMADPDSLLVHELMKRRGDEEAHHKVPLMTMNLLYKNLNETEAAELTEYFGRRHGMGNSILNLINMPKETHQGGIHAISRAWGYEEDGKSVPRGFVQDMLDASEMPMEYRKHIGDLYLDKAVKDMEKDINDLLTAHPSMQEKLDLSGVRAAQALKDSAASS